MSDDTRLKQIEALADNIRQRIFEDLKATMSCCPNCEFWQEKPELCSEPVNCPNGPGRPPANIIAYGCPRFKQKVPF